MVCEAERDGAISVLSNLCDILLHKHRAVNICILNSCCWNGSGSESIVPVERVEVSPNIVFRTLFRIVGSNDRESLLVCVHIVSRPCLLAVVYVRDEEPRRVKPTVTSRLLAVLKDIIFVLMSLIIYNVCLATLRERLHIRDLCRGGKLCEVFPSAVPTLIGCEASWLEAVVEVVSHVHKVPDVCSVEQLCSSEATLVVHVRKSEAVRELVAHGSYTVDLPTFSKLTAACEVLDGHSIHFKRFLRHSERAENSFLRPYEVGIVRVCVLSLSGIEHEDLVNDSVSVPVVFCKVHITLLVCISTSIVDKLSDIRLIGSVATIVLTVGLIGVWKLKRSCNIEVELKLSIALSKEIVVETTLKANGIIAEANLVSNTVVVILSIGSRESLFRHLVGSCELYEDDEPTLLTSELPWLCRGSTSCAKSVCL